MNGLLDVQELDFGNLSTEEETALDKALERILASNAECNFNSFNSSI